MPTTRPRRPAHATRTKPKTDALFRFPPTPANYAPLTPVTFLTRSAAVHPDHVAVIHGPWRITYRQLEAGGLRLDPAAHRLEVRGKDVALTATEFRLLRLLLERRGRVQTRARLLADVWGYAEDVDSRTVDTHVRRLRRKLGSEADRLETVIGVGYRLRD